MCRGGFDRAERLSLAVTSRDFRVRGRHANRQLEGQAEAGQWPTRALKKCPKYFYMVVHELHMIT